ncbi:hypothetical protein [Jeotgalibacillus proteolyticus]|uniref:hypothetical protein n=1 Tax=Jeotgalibacillus proteolyticus TaxID=2082395 RepID=UPI003CF25741
MSWTIELDISRKEPLMVLFGFFYFLNLYIYDRCLCKLKEVYKADAIVVKSDKDVAVVNYLIDHETKSIHRTSYAGTGCEFNASSLDYREFTYSYAYVEQLIEENYYSLCNYCEK